MSCSVTLNGAEQATGVFMDRRKRPFSLNKRAATRGKPTWYATIRDPETGAYAERVSTGQTTKVGAEEWTRAYIARQAQEAAERRTPYCASRLPR